MSTSGSSVTPEDLARARAQFRAYHRALGAYTVSATYEEAIALVGGYDDCLGHALAGFRRWLVDRLPDRDYATLAVPSLVAVLAVGQPVATVGGNPDLNARCIEGLFSLLDEFLAGMESQRVRGDQNKATLPARAGPLRDALLALGPAAESSSGS